MATANPQMAAMSHDLLARVALGLPIEPYERKFYRQAVVEHTALVEAITDGQVEAAGRIAREHFSMSTRTLRAVISRGGGGVSSVTVGRVVVDAVNSTRMRVITARDAP